MLNSYSLNIELLLLFTVIITVISLKYYKDYRVVSVSISLFVLLLIFIVDIYYLKRQGFTFEGFKGNNEPSLNNNLKLVKLKPDYTLSEYYPQGVKVSGVKRDENFKIEHLPKEKRNIDITKHYDYDTLFHNIFLDYYNEKVVIIGPHLYNFYDLLFPATFNGFGREVQLDKNSNEVVFNVKPFKIIIDIDKNKVLTNEPNKVSITFKTGQTLDFDLKRNNFKCKDRILVTKQKNNKEQWINDWIKHYNTKYNIDSIIIFDNNTEEKQSNKLCKTLNNNVSNFIPYRYNFGIPGVFQTCMLQEELLEIAKFQFCSANTLLFSFDIDELLQISNNTLNNKLQNNNNKINLNFLEWVVPVTVNPTNNYSFKDFKYKDAKPSKKGFATKYITTIDKDKKVYLSVHSAKNYLQTQFMEDHFLHFRGLNSDWKVGWDGRSSVKKFYKDTKLNELVPITEEIF